MPKKPKLSLETIKVKSFITALNTDNEQQLKGGDDTFHACLTQIFCQSEAPSGQCCPSDFYPCP